MIIWLNGAFGAGKTTCAYELNRRLAGSFVYDPENIGYFIRKNTPPELHKADFQDHEQWRIFNLEMLTYLWKSHEGPIIVPMTLINPQYYDEIISELLARGAAVKHLILIATRETIERRLSKRIELGNSWAKQQIDCCINAFETDISGIKIQTDYKSVDDIISEIALISGVTLMPDRRGYFKKLFHRGMVLLRHIRQ